MLEEVRWRTQRCIGPKLHGAVNIMITPLKNITMSKAVGGAELNCCACAWHCKIYILFHSLYMHMSDLFTLWLPILTLKLPLP